MISPKISISVTHNGAGHNDIMPLQNSYFESEKFCLLAAVSMSYISYPKSKVVGANLVHYTYNTMSSQELQALFYIKFKQLR